MLRGFIFHNNIKFHSPSSENLKSHNTHKGSPVLTYAFIVSSEIGAMKTLVLSVNLTLSVPTCRITPVNTVCARPSNLLRNWLHSHIELCENGGFNMMHLYWLLCGQVSMYTTFWEQVLILFSGDFLLEYYKSYFTCFFFFCCGRSFDQSHDPLNTLFTRPLR